MDRDALQDCIRRLRPVLAESGVTHVAMFGSRARGDERPESDLDLLIEVEDDRTFSLLDLVGVQHTIGDEVGLSVHATMRRSLSEKLREAVAADVCEVF